ncbi:aminotransferase class IV family protein [Thermosipho ferrireducens]|uniref:Aminotransferase class IV family protein n=1 Tax=Thermosipho ferrireducens TaxID=2571116 RepID=A0ABX7S6S9_9BACT|nr:aminotransferase class IV [Thermosipho ferrireducens]QTA38287.1 aminotransferase class IV family protein [Thermosipho ferrireducens]
MSENRSQIDEILNGLINGIGIYETVRLYNGKPFAIEEHYKRLLSSLSYVTDEKLSVEDFERFVFSNDEGDVRVKIICVVSDRLRCFSKEERIESDEEFFNKEIVIDISNIRHADPLSIPPNFKSLGRPDLYLARLNKGNFYDVILLGNKGQVCEGSFSNIFIIKNKKIITPSLESGILNGITRKHVLKMLRESGYEVIEKYVELKEIIYADEVFLTHTSRGIVPVNSLGNKVNFSVEMSKYLTKMFEEYVNAKIQ